VYVRIVRGMAKEGQVEELARRWEGFVAPRLKQQPGFRGGYFSGDRAGTQVVGVTVWDGEPDRARAEQLVQEFRAQVQDLVAQPPTIEDHEVLVEVRPQ
jgi:heme-degrading monooxygenase HmoA